jgi:hypothetical protein
VGDFGTGYTKDLMALGDFKEGETVNVTLTLDDNRFYIRKREPVFYYLDETAFRDAFERLGNHGQLAIHDGWTEDHFTGALTTETDDRLVLTTIPYDEGWRITVDGKAVEPVKVLNALIAFRIDDAGSHTVELEYRPGVVYFGLYVSFLFLALFLLTLLALRLRPFRRLLYGNAACVYAANWDFDGEDAYYDDPAALPDGTEPPTLRAWIGQAVSALRARTATPKTAESESESNESNENEE